MGSRLHPRDARSPQAVGREVAMGFRSPVWGNRCPSLSLSFLCCTMRAQLFRERKAIREARFLFRRESLKFGHTTVETREAVQQTVLKGGTPDTHAATCRAPAAEPQLRLSCLLCAHSPPSLYWVFVTLYDGALKLSDLTQQRPLS